MLTQFCVLDQPLAVDILLYRLHILFVNILFGTCEFAFVTRWSDVITSDLSLNLELMTPGIKLYTYVHTYTRIGRVRSRGGGRYRGGCICTHVYVLVFIIFRMHE